jgi:hypothetical protein
MARRPVFAILHEASTAIEVLRENPSVEMFTFPTNSMPEPAALCHSLECFVKRIETAKVNYAEEFVAMSARESSRILADALDKALAI